MLIPNKFKFIFKLSVIFFFNTNIYAIGECPTIPFANTDELLIAGYHATIAKTTSGYEAWGDNMGPTGLQINTPLAITPGNGYNYTGTLLFAALGDDQGSSNPQSFVLSTTNLYVWGDEGRVINDSLTTSTTFQAISLPVGVVSADVAYMSASSGVLVILTNNGSVFVMASATGNVESYGDGSGAFDSNWHQATLPAVALIKPTEDGIFAVTTAGDYYTWGLDTVLGDGNGVFTPRNMPTLMTPPFAGVASMIGVTGGDNGNEDLAYFALNPADSKIYSLGENSDGQLGIGSTTNATTWQIVQNAAGTGDLIDVVFLNSANVSEGHPAVSAITSDGTPYVWGDNNGNMLSDAAATNQTLPIVPSGFAQGVEFATFVANSGHYTLVQKFGIDRPCFVGHRAEGNVGDGSAAGGFINQLNCSVLPVLDYCFSTESDFTDEPVSYGSASHELEPVINLTIGVAVDSEATDIPTPDADGDTDDGVTFESFLDGLAFRIRTTITGQNDTGIPAMLCGYLDGAADSTINNSYESNVDYTVGGSVGSGTITASAGNEEICIEVPAASGAATDSTYTAIAGFNGGAGHCDSTAADGSFSCWLDFNPDFTVTSTTFARFRLTTDPIFFATDTGPSPIDAISSGEVESYKIDFAPTIATIGKVDLQTTSVETLLKLLQLDKLSDEQLLDLLIAWDKDSDLLHVNAARIDILNSIIEYFDPDGDNQVAVLRWDTLEERGTIGFYVDRKVEGTNWERINNDLLPGLISSPMGGEYLLADPNANSNSPNFYRLIELEANGTLRNYGPYRLELK